jgi:phosphate acetyltransferase
MFILVIAAHQLDTAIIAEQIELAVQQFGGVGKTSFAGYILTKTQPGTNAAELHKEISSFSNTVKSGKLPFLGAIPYEHTLIAPRMLDVANHLNSKVLFNGDIGKQGFMTLWLLPVLLNILPIACALVHW